MTFLSIQALQGQELDGYGNNIANPSWGSSNTQFLRLSIPEYDDGLSEPRMEGLPNPRLVSNKILNQEFPHYDEELSDFFWVYGQFVDHDLVLNRGNSGETVQIDVPSGDPFFDPLGNGFAKMQISRSKTFGDDAIRQHSNETSSFLDCSAVYSTSQERLNWLRTHQGGKLKTSEGENLPYNTIDGKYSSEIDFTAPLMELNTFERPEKYYVAGDIRANEHPGLSSIHILFMREHNRLCEELKSKHPEWDDEQLFQSARKYNISYFQAITVYEWLPLLRINLGHYEGYDLNVNPSISSEFSTTAFRFGHSLVNEQILRLDDNGNEWSFGSISIKEAFFSTQEILNEGGIAPILRGMKAQNQQKLDVGVVGSLRNFLFGPPGSGGMDLSVMNILRGRERGISDFNSIREAIGLTTYNSFYQLCEDSDIIEKMEDIYEIDNIDPWVGMLAEKKVGNNPIGETMKVIIQNQFESLRSGDRFWFENDSFFSDNEKNQIRNTTLAELIERNTNVKNLDEVFKANGQITAILNNEGNIIDSYNFKLFPNPFFDNVNIEFDSNRSWIGNLVVSDLSGRRLFEREFAIKTGSNLISFDLQGLSKGTLIFQIFIDKGVEILKVTKN